MGEKVKSYIEKVGAALRREILIYVKAAGLITVILKAKTGGYEGRRSSEYLELASFR